jgi:hypothetical protein
MLARSLSTIALALGIASLGFCADSPPVEAGPLSVTRLDAAAAVAGFKVIENKSVIPVAAYSRLPFVSSGYDDERLTALRKTHLLEQITAPARDEWSAQSLLKEWVYGKIPLGNPTSPAVHALDILEKAARGEKFYCTHYAITYAECATALGWQARKLGIDRPHGKDGFGSSHHGVAEIWSNHKAEARIGLLPALIAGPGNVTVVDSKSGPLTPTSLGDKQLSPYQLWFYDEQSMLGYLDKAENGLGSRFQTARERLQALGDTLPAPEAAHHGAWQEAKKEYDSLASEVGTAKLRHFEQTQREQLLNPLKQALELLQKAPQMVGKSLDTANNYALERFRAVTGNPEATSQDMARGFNDETTRDQFRAAIQKELASGEKPVPRHAAEAILSHMDDTSKWLLYAGLGLSAIAALGSLLGFGGDWMPLLGIEQRKRDFGRRNHADTFF